MQHLKDVKQYHGVSSPQPVSIGPTKQNKAVEVTMTDTSAVPATSTAPLLQVQTADSEQDPVINPDLPTRDSLYLFLNFSSYSRSPKQGSQGVRDEQLRHASRLLDHARDLAQDQRNRISILHVKYRFPEEPGSKLLQGNPRPFPVMLDPVLKIDMKPTGSFEPTFAAAILQHIAQSVRPAPKCLVIAYVGADVTATHVRDLSIWCSNRVPAITTFSVAECRIREVRPLEECLGEAIDISMYLNEGESPLFEREYIASKESASGYRPNGRSTSGGSYLRAKEKALRTFGVITNSYSSARGSWRSENSGGLSSMRIMKGHTLEAIIDSMGLGDGDEAAAGRYGQQSPEPVRQREALFVKPRSGASASKRSWNQPGSGDLHKSGDRTWRDLVVAQNDRFNPEYIDPDM